MAEAKNLKLEHCYEQLEAIDKATKEKKIELLKKYGSESPLSFILSLNYNETIVLALPSGMAPFKRDEGTHRDFMGKLVNQIERLKLCRVGANSGKWKKEKIFLEICENVPVPEAEVLCFAKDKALIELYPSITEELVQSVFPGYVKKDPNYVRPTVDDMKSLTGATDTDKVA